LVDHCSTPNEAESTGRSHVFTRRYLFFFQPPPLSRYVFTADRAQRLQFNILLLLLYSRGWIATKRARSVYIRLNTRFHNTHIRHNVYITIHKYDIIITTLHVGRYITRSAAVGRPMIMARSSANITLFHTKTRYAHTPTYIHTHSRAHTLRVIDDLSGP